MIYAGNEQLGQQKMLGEWREKMDVEGYWSWSDVRGLEMRHVALRRGDVTDLRKIRDDEEKDKPCDMLNNVVVAYISVECASKIGGRGVDI
jgi:hypothetical protein